MARQLGRINAPEVAALPPAGDYPYQVVGYQGTVYYWDPVTPQWKATGQAGGGNPVDGTISTGSLASTISNLAGALSAQLLGAVSSAMGFAFNFAPFAIGAAALAMAIQLGGLLFGVGSVALAATQIMQGMLPLGSAALAVTFGFAMAPFSIGQKNDSLSLLFGGLTFGAGNKTDAISNLITSLAPFSFGQIAGALGAHNGALAVIAGASAATLSSSQSGTSTQSAGSLASAMALQLGGFSQSAGSSSASFSASSQIVANGLPGAAARTDIPSIFSNQNNDATWQNPSNAISSSDSGAVASITAASTTLANKAYSDRLDLTSFSLGQAPSGFARTKVELLINQSYNMSVGATLSNVQHNLNILKSDRSGSFTVFTRVQNAGDRAALALDTYDITSNVSGWTEAELQALRVECEAYANHVLGVATDSAWNVDYVQIRTTYTKSGIA